MIHAIGEVSITVVSLLVFLSRLVVGLWYCVVMKSDHGGGRTLSCTSQGGCTNGYQASIYEQRVGDEAIEAWGQSAGAGDLLRTIPLCEEG